MSAKKKVEEISPQELDELITRVEHAISHELALSVEDMKLLLLAIHTLATLQNQLENNDVTVFKLKKLLGLVKKTEQGHSVLDRKKKNLPLKKKTKSSLDKKTKTTPPPKVVHHALMESKKGEVCPHCQRGKLYKFEPGSLLRVSGHAPFEATQHISERLRCNACLEVMTAELPEEILADGAADQQYGYSARALMALQKFYSGTPYYHQGNVSTMLGVSLSASTVFDQCEYVGNDLIPIFNYLKNLAANAHLFLVDDTPNKILEQKPELRKKRNGQGMQLRSGIYSSGVIAVTESNQEIVLFETSLGHAGEFLDSILEQRNKELPAPAVMSDALSSNTPTKISVKSANCNAHCRREFVDLHAKYPEKIEWLIETYGKIWKNESEIKEKKLNPSERLAYHQENSLPVMIELKKWALAEQASNDFEEHSAFGKAIYYLLRHFNKLILFCVEPHVPIDNNRMEETLKIIIRGRKMFHFFRTKLGAEIGNIITSVIATAMRAEINLFDYLVIVQRHQKAVRQNPAAWLPWTYQETLSATEKIQKAA